MKLFGQLNHFGRFKTAKGDSVFQHVMTAHSWTQVFRSPDYSIGFNLFVMLWAAGVSLSIVDNSNWEKLLSEDYSSLQTGGSVGPNGGISQLHLGQYRRKDGTVGYRCAQKWISKTCCGMKAQSTRLYDSEIDFIKVCVRFGKGHW